MGIVFIVVVVAILDVGGSGLSPISRLYSGEGGRGLRGVFLHISLFSRICLFMYSVFT